jgi:hypothetical protein
MFHALLLAFALVQNATSPTPAPGWSSAAGNDGPDGYKKAVWTIDSDDASATLEVRCTTGRVKAATIVLTTKESLLKMADDDGEIEYALSFGDALEPHGTHVARGFHGFVVSNSKKDVQRLIVYDGQPLLVRVSGHDKDALFTFPLAGAKRVGLGAGCDK